MRAGSGAWTELSHSTHGCLPNPDEIWDGPEEATAEVDMYKKLGLRKGLVRVIGGCPNWSTISAGMHEGQVCCRLAGLGHRTH